MGCQHRREIRSLGEKFFDHSLVFLGAEGAGRVEETAPDADEIGSGEKYCMTRSFCGSAGTPDAGSPNTTDASPAE